MRWIEKFLDNITSYKVWIGAVATCLIATGKISEWAWLTATVGIITGRIFEYYTKKNGNGG